MTLAKAAMHLIKLVGKYLRWEKTRSYDQGNIQSWQLLYRQGFKCLLSF